MALTKAQKNRMANYDPAATAVASFNPTAAETASFQNIPQDNPATAIYPTSEIDKVTTKAPSNTGDTEK